MLSKKEFHCEKLMWNAMSYFMQVLECHKTTNCCQSQSSDRNPIKFNVETSISLIDQTIVSDSAICFHNLRYEWGKKKHKWNNTENRDDI